MTLVVGTLTLRTRRLADTHIVMEVQDTGRGMPKDVLDHALDPFFTTKGVGKGTGLGLPLALATAHAHDGELEIRSEEGKGTVVQLRLPVLPKGETLVAGGTGAGARECKARILLVDDDELILASVPSMLRAFGHWVATADGGQAALDCIGTGESFDLVILDLNMPGLNGIETLNLLRQTKPDLPVLLATGFLDRQTEAALARDPRALAISKPFSLDALNRRIQELTLNRSREATETWP
jgi:CheY-like chemotaxis protein